MNASMVWRVLMLALVSQACSFSNAPFYPSYNVEVDVLDPLQTVQDNTLKATFDRGSIALVNSVGSCTVQLKLGQCKNAEEVWINFRAQPDDPNCGNRCPCTPSVWQRLKNASGHSLALAADPQLTRASNQVYLEVLAGPMQDTDGNGVVDKRTNENRIATLPLSVGKVEIYKATDGPRTDFPNFGQGGEFYADLEASDPLVGYVRGRVDAAVAAPDGAPVGPPLPLERHAASGRQLTSGRGAGVTEHRHALADHVFHNPLHQERALSRFRHHLAGAQAT